MPLSQEALDLVKTTYSAKFEDTLSARADGQHKMISTTDTFSSSGYMPGLMGGVGSGQEWVGARLMKQIKTYGIRFVGKLYENSVKRQVVDLQDDPAAPAASIAAAMAKSAKIHEEKETFDVFKSNKDGFDSEPLFGEHTYTSEIGATVYNNSIETGTGPYFYLLNEESAIVATRTGEDYTPQILSGGDLEFNEDAIAMGWRARKVIAPGFWANSVRSNKALNAENFDEALQLAHSFRNDEGDNLAAMPKYLVVPRSLEAAASKLIKTALVNGGETNIYFNRLEVIVTDYL